MRRVRALLGFLLALAGALVVLPSASVYWRYSHATGDIKDVFEEPLGSDRIRLHVVFEFTLDVKGVRTTYFGANQADGHYHVIEDPIVDKATAAAMRRALLGDDPRFRRARIVYFEAEDPPGTAFIVSEAAGAPSRRYEIGLAMVAAGLLTVMFSRPLKETV